MRRAERVIAVPNTREHDADTCAHRAANQYTQHTADQHADADPDAGANVHGGASSIADRDGHRHTNSHGDRDRLRRYTNARADVYAVAATVGDLDVYVAAHTDVDGRCHLDPHCHPDRVINRDCYDATHRDFRRDRHANQRADEYCDRDALQLRAAGSMPPGRHVHR